MFVGHNGRKYVCYLSPNGIARHYLGCRHALPKEAAAHTVPVFVSPRRSGNEPITVPVPLAGAVGAGSFPEPWKRGSRPVRTGRL